MNGPRLGYVILYVKNVLDTVAFYREAFGLKERFIHESKQYAEMETGQTSLAFANENFVRESYPFRQNRLNQEAPGAEIALIFKDVNDAFNQALKAGAVEVLAPAQKPWGQTVSYVRDQNGFIVEICDAI
ncbi:MAG: VOC family protein [Chlamydiales bacterium]|nr:VOC family protein [Chlamydiales bacterium]